MITIDITGRCTKCGKKVESTMGCDCEHKERLNGNNVLYGWICPLCGVVHSPFSTECHCYPNTITSSETSFYYTKPINGWL